MDYQTFLPQLNLASLVKCYWTLRIPADKNAQKQRIIPDGCLEMAFILGDDIKRYKSDNEYILQPRAMILGQTLEPYYIEPTGDVDSFAVRFYPYGFANFIKTPIKDLANKETALAVIFGKKTADELEQKIINAPDTQKRIEIIEDFLLNQLINEISIDSIVKSTIDAMLASKGSTSINAILQDDLSKRRKLERKFSQQIGISPKQLGKVIRLQAALNSLLNEEPKSLTQIAYDSEYYDQAHFIKDFKEFTGTIPKDFIDNDKLELSSLFYSEE